MTKAIKAEKVVSTSAGIKITAITLSSAAKAALTTGGVRLPKADAVAVTSTQPRK